MKDPQEPLSVDQPAERIALRGELSEIPPSAVLQMLEMGRKTGCLEVSGPAGKASLWLADGQPVHASSESCDGADAAHAIVCLSSGSFVFRIGETPPATTLALSITELLLEATLREDTSA